MIPVELDKPLQLQPNCILAGRSFYIYFHEALS